VFSFLTPLLRPQEEAVLELFRECGTITQVRLGLGRIVVSEQHRLSITELTGTDYLRESGIKWTSGSAERQCDRTLRL
jgi:hypothetical protein